MKKFVVSSEYSGEYIRESDTYIQFGDTFSSFQCVLCSQNGFSSSFEIFGKKRDVPKKLKNFLLNSENKQKKLKKQKINVTVDGPEIKDFKLSAENEKNSQDPKPIKARIGLWIHLNCSEISGDVLRDIEGVIEKKTGDLISEIKGVSHENLRNEILIKIRRKEVFEGFRFKDLGYCLGKRICLEYPFVESANIRIVSNQAAVKEESIFAEYIYNERDRKAKVLHDESVSKFYACKMCQNATPEHICIITPDHPSVCGTIYWQEAKAFEAVNPDGPISGFEKGNNENSITGEYSGINKKISEETKGRIKNLNLYSLFVNPHTTGACTEIIAFAIPELNGFGLIDRMSPAPALNGLTFEELKATISGGTQIPGFRGVGEPYLYSPNFFKKESGWENVVWITSSLKNKILKGMDVPEIESIPTENEAKSVNKLKSYYENRSKNSRECEKLPKKSDETRMSIEFSSLPLIEKTESGNEIIKIPNVKISKLSNR